MLSFTNVLCLFFALTSCMVDKKPASDLGWQNLFDGASLDGWRQLGGAARYHVQDGAIVGTVAVGTENSFLASYEEYGDFILEFDVKVDPALTAGVQFRSLKQDHYNGGHVFGYQLRTGGSSPSWSGGIYDEGRRGWLYSLSRSPPSRAAFRASDWNHVRLEVIGKSIRSWVNGVPTADLVDDVTSKGFLALQVPAISDDVYQRELQIHWRNIRIKTDNLGIHKTPENKDIEQFSFLKNKLTSREENEGWELLWDGETDQGWVGAKTPWFPEKGWKMEDGVLSVMSSGGGEARNGGDIITQRDFSNFELELDFRISLGANSGIKYFVDPDLLKGRGSAIGLEFQILDDELHPDAKKGVSGNRTLGSLYDLISAANLSEGKGSAKRVNPPEQWNRARIVVRGDSVEHWLNNTLVVKYRRGTQMFKALVAYSKYAKWPNFGEWDTGPILLQDHGDLVSFRSIKIKDFDSLGTQ